MQLIYLDESECRQYDKYFVGALMATEDVVHDMVGELDDLGETIASSFPVNERAEFHAYDIMARRGDWANMGNMRDACNAILEDVVRVVTSYDIEICVRGVDTDGLAQRYVSPEPAHSVCLEHILQRIHPPLKKNSDFGLLIADEHKLATVLRDQLRTWKVFGTRSAYMKTQTTRMLDTIQFTPSNESRMLQAIDVVLYFYQRRYFNGGKERAGGTVHAKEKALIDSLEQMIDPVLHSGCGTWHP